VVQSDSLLLPQTKEIEPASQTRLFLFGVIFVLLTLHVKQAAMKFLYVLCILLFTASPAQGQKVFKVKYESQADLKVYVVEYESQCDLKVFFVEYESQANEDGLWYFVEYESQADKKLYFVEYESQADLKIYIVKYKSQAGWRETDKQHLLL
jgi:hypothetical protein